MNRMYMDEINKTDRSFLKNNKAGDVPAHTENSFSKAKHPAGDCKVFGSLFAEKSQYAADRVLSETELSSEDMSMAEYKEYIYDKISRIPIHPSRYRDSIAVFITDAGFERMKNDPAYENWVLDVLRKDFSFYDPWADRCGGSFVIHRFGETESEYHAESWRKDISGGKSRYDKTAEESFWERRRRRKKRIEEIMRQREKQKRELKKLDQKLALTRESYRDFLEGKEDTFLTHR